MPEILKPLKTNSENASNLSPSRTSASFSKVMPEISLSQITEVNSFKNDTSNPSNALELHSDAKSAILQPQNKESDSLESPSSNSSDTSEFHSGIESAILQTKNTEIDSFRDHTGSPSIASKFHSDEESASLQPKNTEIDSFGDHTGSPSIASKYRSDEESASLPPKNTEIDSLQDDTSSPSIASKFHSDEESASLQPKNTEIDSFGDHTGSPSIASKFHSDEESASLQPKNTEIGSLQDHTSSPSMASKYVHNNNTSQSSEFDDLEMRAVSTINMISDLFQDIVNNNVTIPNYFNEAERIPISQLQNAELDLTPNNFHLFPNMSKEEFKIRLSQSLCQPGTKMIIIHELSTRRIYYLDNNDILMEIRFHNANDSFTFKYIISIYEDGNNLQITITIEEIQDTIDEYSAILCLIDPSNDELVLYTLPDFSEYTRTFGFVIESPCLLNIIDNYLETCFFFYLKTDHIF